MQHLYNIYLHLNIILPIFFSHATTKYLVSGMNQSSDFLISTLFRCLVIRKKKIIKKKNTIYTKNLILIQTNKTLEQK
jgi:hypothetical protein